MRISDASPALFFVTFSAGMLITPEGMAQAANGDSKQNRPNVIIVMTDDQGYGELSCHGNPVLKTPNLDKLYDQSVRFTNFHVAPMCTPTRGQLMTGMHAAKNGAINVSSGRALLRPELLTMADYFAMNDYGTGIFGKWHLGDNYPFRPGDRGFQEAMWFPSSHIGSVPDYWGNDYFNDKYMYNGKRETFTAYCTDVFFDHAIEWMKEQDGKGRPFFLYLPTNTPHGPLIAPEEDITDMRKAFEESEFAGLNPGLKERLITYLAMIRNIDKNMGKLMSFLKQQGLEENTILIFTTDNGSTFGPQYFNAGMRGKKTELYEGGHRVPLFIRWPAGHFNSPRDVSGLTQVQDILPCLIDLCELEIPNTMKFDGISLAPVLQGKEEIDEERMLIINYSRMPSGFEFPSPAAPSRIKRDGAGVLWKSWRLLEDRELYNLSEDPLQQKNVIDDYPAIANKMRSGLNDWWETVEDIANEPQRIVIGNDKENPMMITACEWMDVFLDMQLQVERADRKNSYWNLMVERDGNYEFDLRRWPKELDMPLNGAPENAEALPIETARILISEVRHFEERLPFTFEGLKKQLKDGDKSAVFTIPLKAGPITLHSWFDDQQGNTLCGAYYVYIKRLD